ncbi:MAG: hypothetical protein WA876_05925 [Candidatus Acidiferrales bacterium]
MKKKPKDDTRSVANDALPHDLLVATAAGAATAIGTGAATAIGKGAVLGVKKLVEKAKPKTKESKIILTDKDD